MKKWVSRIIWILVIIAILVLIYKGLDFILTDDVDSMSRCTLHSFYLQDKIDTLFIGPSHSMFCIDTPKLSEALNSSFFALSTSDMSYIQMYYTLKEVFRTKQIPNVYIEISPSRLTLNKTQDIATYIITDYMKSPVYRMEMIAATVPPESYINGLLRLRRTMQQMPDYKEIPVIVNGKLSEEYKARTLETYLGRGFWRNDDSLGAPGSSILYIDSEHFDDAEQFGQSAQSQQMEYLKKCINLCKKKNAKVHFYVPPFSSLYLMRMPYYSTIMQEIKDLAFENKIPFLDFNCVKKEYLNLNLGDFSNPDHMNTDGSSKLAAFLIQYLKNPSEQYFGDSLENGYHEEDGIVAVGYTRTLEKNNDKITGMHVGITAYPDAPFPVNVRLFKVKFDDAANEWLPVGDEIRPEKITGSITYYSLSYDYSKSSYSVELLDQKTGHAIWKSITQFQVS